MAMMKSIVTPVQMNQPPILLAEKSIYRRDRSDANTIYENAKYSVLTKYVKASITTAESATTKKCMTTSTI